MGFATGTAKPTWVAPNGGTMRSAAHCNRCDWFAVVMSPAATRSEWVKRELLYVLDAGRYGRKIVPLLHKPCNHARLSWTLGAFQFVDFTRDFEDGCRDLLRIWGQAYRRRGSGNRKTDAKKAK